MAGRGTPRGPTYPLAEIQRLFERDQWVAKRGASRRAVELQYTRYDICDCILGIEPDDFHKTMSDCRNPDLWQDVYRARYEHGEHLDELYVKLQISQRGTAVLISFKLWGSPE